MHKKHIQVFNVKHVKVHLCKKKLVDFGNNKKVKKYPLKNHLNIYGDITWKHAKQSKTFPNMLTLCPSLIDKILRFLFFFGRLSSAIIEGFLFYLLLRIIGNFCC